MYYIIIIITARLAPSPGYLGGNLLSSKKYNNHKPVNENKRNSELQKETAEKITLTRN